MLKNGLMEGVGLVGLRVNIKILAAQGMVIHPSSLFIFADK
jgi:hypothetical protein